MHFCCSGAGLLVSEVHWGGEKLSILSEVTQLVSGRIRIQIQPISVSPDLGDPRDQGGQWAQGPSQEGLIHSFPSMEGLGVLGCLD